MLLPRIDRALAEISEIRSGAEPYRRRLAEHGSTFGDAPQKLVQEVVVELAAEWHRACATSPVELLEFSDGAFDVLFDIDNELTVMVHGLSRATPANSRDERYHRGFPGRPGYDKGHAIAHAHGGREGGPNYFLQIPRVNRRLSPAGSLWRDIETYLAKNSGLFSFVRLAYAPGLETDVPFEVEYGVLAEGEFRAVIFPNAA